MVVRSGEVGVDVAPGVSLTGAEECQSFCDLLEEVFSAGPARKVALFATVAWCIWQRRNWLRENQSTWKLHELGDNA